MLQRHQRATLEQIVASTRHRIQADFEQLKTQDLRRIQLSKTAQFILDMYSNVSHPMTCLQIIKQKFEDIKHPHSLQLDLILDKAEMFYIESVTHDLNKVRQQENILAITAQDIRDCVQEINWKLGFDRDSILNESQEIGDNIDLMKFFEGVRNYQNWEEVVDKQCIEKLKHFAYKTENQLTLKKGFLTAKINNLFSHRLKENIQSFFQKTQRINNLAKKLENIGKIARRREKEAFQKLYVASNMKPQSVILQQSFKILYQKFTFRSLIKFSKTMLSYRFRLSRLSTVLKKIEERKKWQGSIHFFRSLMGPGQNRILNLGAGSQKLKHFAKKYSVWQMMAALGIHRKAIISFLDRLYSKNIKESFFNIRTTAEDNKPKALPISRKMKAKILLSLQKHENKPIDMRKTFLSWYLKGQEQKYAKMIYNIWLNGNTSKFTFFMRIKNAIHQSKKMKVKPEMKVFLLVFMQKMNGYYNHCQKSFISKWHARHKHCKQLSYVAKSLDYWSNNLNRSLEKESLEAIKHTALYKKYLSKYLSKRITSFNKNVKNGFDTWKTIPNIKKNKGKAMLLKILRERIKASNEGQRQTFEAFKVNRVQGRSKMVKLLTKIFAKDLLYLSVFMNTWKSNVKQQNFKQMVERKEEETKKSGGIRGIVEQLKRKQNQDIKNSLNKFRLMAKFSEQRKSFTIKVLERVLANIEQKNITASFSAFKQDLTEGQQKKNRLVANLINANKIKQAEIFYSLRTHSQMKRDEEIKERVAWMFSSLQSSIKVSTNVLYGKDTLYNVLQKMAINYTQNVRICFSVVKNLPLRIDWKKKSNTLELYDRLAHLVQRDKVGTFGKFKDNHYKGQFQKKKMLDIMTFRYVDSTKNYFKIYLNEVREAKLKEKHHAISTNFESLLAVTRNNYEILLEGQKVWQKKLEYLKKLDTRMKDKLKQAMKIWHSSAKTLTYYNQINNQKKKRLLGFMSEILKKNGYTETKNVVQLFQKNSNITKIQTKFLNKLCDSQAGKVIKAMMIWKNLPKPSNKQLIAKASKFESALHHFGHKILRTSFSKFKDQHYIGNDRKKMAIRKLVAMSCSGIDKYFSIWAKNNKMITVFSKCHKLEYMAQCINQIQAQQFGLLFEGRRSREVESSFLKIGDWWNRKTMRLFKAWRNKVKVLKKQDEIKQRVLSNLFRIEDINHKKRIIEIAKKIKTQAFLRRVVSAHFLQRHKNNLHESFQQISKLPDWKRRNRQTLKRQRLLKISSLLVSQELKDKNLVFSAFRDEKYQGNFKKFKSCEAYLKDRISQVHKILALWQNMTQEDKRNRRAKTTENLFYNSNQIVKANLSQIFENLRQTQLKKNTLNKLFKAMEIKTKGFFTLWHSRMKQIKMNEMINNTQKKAILQKINKMIAGTSEEKVKGSIKLFYRNFKVTKVQRKFIQKLLQTKSGKVVEAFGVWRDLPNQNMMEKYKKGQKFFFRLEGMMKKKLKEAHNEFLESTDEGSTIKKQAVIKLLDITSNGMRRYYNRWDNTTKRDKTLQQANNLFHSLETMHSCVSNTFLIVFADQRSTKIKTWAIEKLINSCSQNTNQYFKRWRNNIREQKAIEELLKKEKSAALKIFTNVLGNSEKSQVKDIVGKFKKNYHIQQISKNFLNKLLKTKSGKVIQLFHIWKGLPSAKLAAKKKKAIKFESNLHKISGKFLKKVFEPFKTQSFEARNKKKYCIDRLIRASMGEEKKKFFIWRQIVKQEKILSHTHLFDSLFQKMEGVLSHNLELMIKDTGKEISQKKNLCRKLINNSNFVQHHAYFVWKEALHTDNVKIQKQESYVKVNLMNLINIDQKAQCKKIVEVISKFKNKHNEEKKNIAERVKENKNKRTIKFHERLCKFSDRRVSLFLTALSKQNMEANLINKNKSLQEAFENMNLLISDHFRIVLRSNRETIIIQKALNKIFANVSVSLSKAFQIWKQNKNILSMQQAMTDEKKKTVLNVLNKFMDQQEKTKIPWAVKKFEKNFKSLKLRKQILTKILKSKAGKVPLAFIVWKSLPNPEAKKMKAKASKFQTGLARLHFKKLKGSFEHFKNDQHDGNVKKKYAANKLIQATMSDQNRIFNKWRKVSHEGRITDKMCGLSQVFHKCQWIIKENNLIFENPTKGRMMKVSAIQKLISNTNQNLIHILGLWGSINKDEKCYKIEKALSKWEPDVVAAEQVRWSFEKLKGKADLQILRTYINSLWKWKMSNVEANYYAKFIKVFKESEQLIILSNVFNKKQYEHLHHGFRGIFTEGASRHQRKYRITEKYLTRKLSNYFQRFKLNACFQQINNWRRTYKEAVKGKSIAEVAQRLVRKTLKDSFMALDQNSKVQKNAQRLTYKLQILQFGLVRDGLQQIGKAGYRRFLTRIIDSFERFSGERVRNGFSQIKILSYLNILSTAAGKVSQKYLKKHALSKILHRSSITANYRMGLKFLSYAQNQTMKNKAQQTIKMFRKLAEKAHALRNILGMLGKKEAENLKQLFKIEKEGKERSILLARFMKGMKIKKILDKQDRKLLQKTLNLLKKKENIWMANSIKRFVVRSNIKSSMAVSLWRIKNFHNSETS